MLQNLDWKTFGIKGESPQISLENLCMYLCCDELQVQEIEAYHNQPGLETEPLEVGGVKYGFQVKFFESKFDWNQVEKSITKSIQLYPDLDKIFIYSNKNRTKGRQGGGQTKQSARLNKLAKKHNVDLVYITNQSILNKLEKPRNIRLAQIYLGIGDELGFIKSGVDNRLLALIRSSEYVNLPIIDSKKNIVKDLPNSILADKNNVSVIHGSPGSGKSILMHKLLEQFGGLDKSTQSEMLMVLNTNDAVPVLINLRSCQTRGFNDVIREYRQDNKIDKKTLRFIYLFDGLDELGEDLAESFLLQAYQLSQEKQTQKIIISCRTGNLNRKRVYTYWDKVVEYQISDLQTSHIDHYFLAKGNLLKMDRLGQLKSENLKLIESVDDILMLSLFWDTVLVLNNQSTIIDLFEKKISLLLDDFYHNKNLEWLNILNPKRDSIINLNEKLSYELQRNHRLQISLKELQSFLLQSFNRLDYKSVNEIINYVADLFFDSTYLRDGSELVYFYAHRRYQEYFSLSEILRGFETDSRIIRELKLLSNREFLDNLFCEYARKYYVRTHNLAGLIELNLISLYLGDEQGFGVDDAYYINAANFTESLAVQSNDIFNELILDDKLCLQDKILPDIESIRESFKKWTENPEDFYTIDSLRTVWENVLTGLMKNITIFWKHGKRDFAEQLINSFRLIRSLFDEYKFPLTDDLHARESFKDPFWVRFEDWMYDLLVIKKEQSLEDVFIKIVRENHKRFEPTFSQKRTRFDEDPKEKILLAFYRVCLVNRKGDFVKVLDRLNKYELIVLLDLLRMEDFLKVWIKDEDFSGEIYRFITECTYSDFEQNPYLLFYKRFYGISLTNEEVSLLKRTLSNVKSERNSEWKMYNTHLNWRTLSYVLEEFDFADILCSDSIKEGLRYYGEIELYTAIFSDYISLLKGKKSASSIIRDVVRYSQEYNEGLDWRLYLSNDITFLLGKILMNGGSTAKEISDLKNLILNEVPIIQRKSLLLSFWKEDPTLFKKVVTEEDLSIVEEDFQRKENDYQSYVEDSFYLSQFYSEVNERKSRFYFEKGIIEGILRHGWRKDIIVSYLLVQALEILWKNNYTSRDMLEKYSMDVFSLCMRLDSITDGKSTWEAPLNMIEMVSQYSLSTAQSFRQKLIEREGRGTLSNKTLTSIIKARIKGGASIEEIEGMFSDYRKSYDYEGKPDSEYYEQKFIVYLEIAKSDLYTKEEKVSSFKKAVDVIEQVTNLNIEYFLNDTYFEEERALYIRLQKVFLDVHSPKLDLEEKVLNRSKISEDTFIQQVQSSNTNRQIRGKYQELLNYENYIILSSFDSWDSLIRKTYQLSADNKTESVRNINLFIDYLKESNYPHNAFWNQNSKYLHLAIAAAIKNKETYDEIFDYLSHNSGHEGFLNVMKAYEFLGDKEMCKTLFKRFLKFCHLIVD